MTCPYANTPALPPPPCNMISVQNLKGQLIFRFKMIVSQLTFLVVTVPDVTCPHLHVFLLCIFLLV